MKIKRLGRVWGAEMGPPWMCSHSTYVAPIQMENGRLRIFLVSRDANSRGLVGWIEVSADNPCHLLRVCDCPSLTPGPLGAFDDRGISIGSVHRIDGKLWLYYMGWNKSADVPFRNSIGLAISQDGTGDHFDRVFDGPLLDRSRFDPFTVSYPFVVPGTNGKPWIMYYGTSKGGGDKEELMQHVITSASSPDGIDWEPTGREEVGLYPGEYGLSRPWIFNNGPDVTMLFSVRRKQYTIGLARRDENGLWVRENTDFISPGTDEWEREAVCYPAVFRHRRKLFLFYSGNGYGRTGFGVAEMSF